MRARVPKLEVSCSNLDLNSLGGKVLDNLHDDEEGSLSDYYGDSFEFSGSSNSDDSSNSSSSGNFNKVDHYEAERRWIKGLKYSEKSPWNHVKYLDCGALWHDVVLFNQESSMDKMAEIFPNVEYLRATNPDTNFFIKLLHSIADSNWTKLKSIPWPQEDSAIPYYVSNVLLLRKNIEFLLLPERVLIKEEERKNQINYFPYQCDRLAKKLDEFPNLIELDIIKYSSQGVEIFDSVLESCRALSSVTYMIYRPQSCSNHSSVPGVVESFHSLVKAHPQIRSVDIKGRMDSDISLQYIMKKFPKILSIDINVFNEKEDSRKNLHLEYRDCDTECSASVLGQFMSYLNNLDGPYDVNHIYAKASEISEALISYWESRSRELQTLEIEYESSDRFNEDDSNFYVSGNKAYIRLEINDDDEMDITVTFDKRQDRDFDRVPHLEIIEKCGYILQELSLLYNGPVNLNAGIEKNVNMERGYCLDHIFKYCPNLEKLSLNNLCYTQCDPIKSINNTLTSLILTECWLSSDILPQLSDRLPSLEALQLTNCYMDTHEDASKRFLSNINMKRTSFETLNLFWGAYVSPPSPIIYIKQVEVENEYYKFVDNDDNNPKFEFAKIDKEEYKNLWKSKKIYGYSYSVSFHCRVILHNLTLTF